MTDPARYAHPHIRELEPYTPGDQPIGRDWIKLNTNESPFPPPQEVRDAIRNELETLARYPNPRSQGLRDVIAEFHKTTPDRVIIGNGSDDLLNLLARAFGGAGHATGETFPSYSLYPVVTAIAGGEIGSVAFGDAFSLPVEDLLAMKPDLLFLTCPNAPSGVRFPLSELGRLAAGLEGLLVIDEAYAEFALENSRSLLDSFRNVAITRTFSKAFGLAGLRVGYALADPAVIDILDRIRDSYNVNRLSQAGAVAAIRAWPYFRECIRKICATRASVKASLEKLGWQVYPSEANFLFAAPVDRSGASGPEVARSLFEWLRVRRILVRYFPKHPLTERHLRISIGSESEMNRFLEAVQEWTRNA